ncbi:MAG: hypothetical protein H6772_02045 [Pseudomonadales bacterium]|nr:hypothetical protein [Pseudomonadales bacterium]
MNNTKEIFNSQKLKQLNLPNADNELIRLKIIEILKKEISLDISTLRFRLINPMQIEQTLMTGSDRYRNSDSVTVPGYEDQPEIVTWTHSSYSFLARDSVFYPNLENENTAIVVYKPDNIKELYSDGTCIFTKKPSEKDVLLVIHLKT